MTELTNLNTSFIKENTLQVVTNNSFIIDGL